MATISSLGSGSGIDLEGLLTKLMTAEQAPLTALQTRQSSYTTRISSLGTLNSALANLQTAAAAMKTSVTQTAASKFASYSASVADTTIATATTTTGAAAGSYSLSNIVLATAQKITKTGITVPSVAGSLSIKVGSGTAVTVNLDADSTLSTVAAKINESGAGVTASIVTSDGVSQLTLTANNTGAANTISISGSDIGGGTAWSSAFDYSAMPTWTGSSGSAIPAGAGTLSVKVGSASAVDVAIGANATLDDVVTAINGANTGATASIVTDGATSYLKLTANSAGATVTVTGSESGGGTAWADYATAGTSNNTSNSWTQKDAAGDASLTIDGVAVTSASNTVTSINGLSIGLLKAGSTTVTVSKDTTSSLKSALNAFITAYNSANSTMASLGTYNATTKIAGALQGNSTLRSAQSQTRALLFDTTTGGTSAYQRLSDIGVTIAKDGSLSLDSTKLTKAINADYTSVATLVTKVGAAYDTTLNSIAGKNGSIATATNGANESIKQLTKRQTELTTRLTKIEAMYRKQFTTLDTTIAQLKNTGTYLTQQIAALNTSSSK